MYCRKCGRKLDDNMMICPTCGENNTSPAKPKKVWPKVLIIVGSILLGLIIVGVVIVLLVFNLFKNVQAIYFRNFA